MRLAVIILILAVLCVAMVVWARRRGVTDLSTQETADGPSPGRDRPAGPAAETMDPDETGGHPTR